MGIMYCCGGSHSTWREFGGVTKEHCNQGVNLPRVVIFGGKYSPKNPMRSNFWRDIFTKKSRQKLCEKENQL